MASEYNLVHLIPFKKKSDLGRAHFCDFIDVVNPSYDDFEPSEDYTQRGMTYLDMANFKWLLKRSATWGYWTIDAEDMDEAIDWACDEPLFADP